MNIEGTVSSFKWIRLRAVTRSCSLKGFQNYISFLIIRFLMTIDDNTRLVKWIVRDVYLFILICV